MESPLIPSDTMISYTTYSPPRICPIQGFVDQPVYFHRSRITESNSHLVHTPRLLPVVTFVLNEVGHITTSGQCLQTSPGIL